MQQAEQSVAAWLRARGIEEYSRKAFKDVVSKDDEPYFQSLQEFIENMGGVGGATRIEELLRDWQLLNDELDIVPETPKVNVEDILPGEEFSFEVVTVNSAGHIIGQETQTNRQQIFDLGNGVNLEMVQIPGGTFVMGAPEGESNSSDRERPQHEVTLEPFWMAKYPITQAQYQAITDNNPSHFRGENRPVEKVNYTDAVEFCQQLSAKLGIEFALPSEAQWEYACRAGTTTPFYFGETITDQLANYDASSTYASEASGQYRKQTTSVGSFPPNAFGLYDMHGNVWEWCADTWHDDYEGAPTDGRAWTEGGNDNCSPLRGGSWLDTPDDCRSACRNDLFRGRDYILNTIGFRVVCVAGRTLSP
ncbi:MAG: SUMF1/EgtB/PvdO family nonheme iron enzyme [Cyanobacteria bacterium]|jgi:formylglycine-generating enzyme required for sulfatase activity|nr:SUMF1/EgtB/PvdO family nonheme iron enzyme [Cyanobacteria bacterium GSL.Bin21]